MDLTAIKNKRKGCKIQLSRIESYIKNLDGSEEICILKVKLQNILSTYESYKNLQSDIIALEDFSDVEVNAENLVSDRFEIAIAQLGSNIEKLKKKLSNSDIIESSNVVLPKINIKPFTGKAFESERDTGIIPTAEEFFEFLNKRQSVLENLNLFEPNSSKSYSRQTDSRKNKVSLVSNVNNLQRQSYNFRANCFYCKDSNHLIYGCSKFLTLKPLERYQFVKSKKYCINCLSNTHAIPQCKSLKRCSTCGKPHHTYLHFDNQSNSSPSTQTHNHVPNINTTTSRFRGNNHGTEPSNVHIVNKSLSPNMNPVSNEFIEYAHPSSQQASLHTVSISDNIVLLPTALVNIRCSNGQQKVARALLDSASQMSLIESSFAKNLQLSSRTQFVNISGLGSTNCAKSREVLDIQFSSLVNPSISFNVSCSVINKITNNLPQFSISPEVLKLHEHIIPELADPFFFKTGPINLLLGADIYFNLLKSNIINMGPRSPSLVETYLGYVIAGPIPRSRLNFSSNQNNVSHSFITTNDVQFEREDELTRRMESFWELETIPLSKTHCSSEEVAEQIFKNTTIILPSGRYQVDMPFLENMPTKLGQSFCMARQRFISLEKKFNCDSVLFQNYKNVIYEYLTLNHAQVIPLSFYNHPTNEFKYFIPHRAVIRKHSSTPVRVVFDFSARTDTGVSLNDLTSKGYQVQDNIFDILCRFRCFKFVLCADIQMMYRFIDINPSQCHFQNFLWRENSSDPFTCIQLSSLSFGQNCAPYLATRVLKDIAERYPNFPNARYALLRQTYMDDILSGTNDFSSLETIYSELNTILGKHGFKLHKWQSNSSEFLSSISQTSSYEIDFNINGSPSNILGLKWNPLSDLLLIRTTNIQEPAVLTKRSILSFISSVFDPLGVINPLIVQGKLIMQKLWQSQISWDTPIFDDSILQSWKKFLSLLSDISNMSIPRYLIDNKTICSISLHGFCDASQLAYGACVYLVVSYNDNTFSSRLIAAKSRVNPLKNKLTIPKLELCSMELLAILSSRIIQILHDTIKIESINLWSDSLVALTWVKRSELEISPFVKKRVLTVRDNSRNTTWRHIRSPLNPADHLSRGNFSSDVRQFWFHGPPFLSQTNDFDSIDSFELLNEVPECMQVSFPITESPEQFWKPIFLKFSKFSSMQKGIAFSFKVILKFKKINISGSPLTVEELQNAHDFIIKQVQSYSFSNEIKLLQEGKSISIPKLLPLNIFLDENSILRVGGRLEHTELSFSQKFPILLPENDHVVDLLINREHMRLGHSGAQNVLGNFRLRYWPLNGIRRIKTIIKKCVICHRFNAQFASQIMSPLPLDRVQQARPFSKTGIDFAGPIMIRSSRLRKAPTAKAYIAIFICMVTKAIHIELVSNLSTEAFIASLKRFISRRGNPQIIYSDNGTNFIGARNQLRDLSLFLKSKENNHEIQNFLSSTEITWKLIPPRSPHWGGLWEAAVKSAKFHLTKLLGNTCLTFEELSTLLVQIEAILNSRPLYPLSNDPNDLLPLTPGHFLIGAPLISYPERDLSRTPTNRLSYWKVCSKLQQEFWRKWSVDYLHRLQHRPKWQLPQQNLAINQLVLIQSEDRPPLNWPLGRILELLTGRDGKVRAARVKTAEGEYVRPIIKLAPLPISD
ncbi:uncharacterized protein [Diabrotica undecimpunctata]|uniref:uncharacterized protein n=1 Tax=Diabrotica undecimpunctata TaxID=50387 RepID=UPI003B635910